MSRYNQYKGTSWCDVEQSINKYYVQTNTLKTLKSKLHNYLGYLIKTVVLLQFSTPCSYELLSCEAQWLASLTYYHRLSPSGLGSSTWSQVQVQVQLLCQVASTSTSTDLKSQVQVQVL